MSPTYLPSSVMTDIIEFCEKHKVPYSSIDEKYAIEDFFKGIIDKYLSLSMETDRRIQDYVDNATNTSQYESGYDSGHDEGYNEGYDEGFEDGKRAQMRKEEALGKK